MECRNTFILINFTCYASLFYSFLSNSEYCSWAPEIRVDDNLMSKHFNFQYRHCPTIFLAEAVRFIYLSHFQQSFHQLLVGWLGGNSEPCFKHLSSAGSEVPRIVLLNHLQLCIFHPSCRPKSYHSTARTSTKYLSWGPECGEEEVIRLGNIWKLEQYNLAWHIDAEDTSPTICNKTTQTTKLSLLSITTSHVCTMWHLQWK